MRILRTCALLACLALVATILPPTIANSATTQTGTYHPLTSTRLLDTRNGTGVLTAGPLGAGGTLQLQVSGRGGVPTTGAAAVVVNLTVTGGSANGFLTAYPSGVTRPGVSSINFVAGSTRANIATVTLGSGGKVAIFNAAGSVSVLVDVVGYYASSASTSTTGNEFDTYGPDRLTDTRTSSEGSLAAHQILSLFVDFSDGAANTYVKALAVNITAVGATGSGFLSAFDGGPTLPKTSTLNFAPSTAIANMAVVKTALCTDCSAPPYPVQFAVMNGSSASVHVIVDLVGIYYNDATVGLRFHPLTSPVRISDSRKALNGHPLTAGQTQALTAPSTVATTGTKALVSNVTAVTPTSSTFFKLWASGDPVPPVSNLNAPAHSIVANGAVIPLSSTRGFSLFNAAGTSDFLVDVTGRFDVGPLTSALSRTVRTHTFGTPSTTTRRESVSRR
jgi:serine protease